MRCLRGPVLYIKIFYIKDFPSRAWGTQFFTDTLCGLVGGSGRCFVGSFSHILFPTFDTRGM